jgi:predicted phage terminase large subunit-like protein
MEEQRRRLARRSLLTFASDVLAPRGQAPAAHHRVIIRELQAVADGAVDRLMLLLPPGSAKSTYASEIFPPWFLAQAPGLSVIGASHTASMAEDFSRKAMRVAIEQADALAYGLTRESVELWETSNRGRYRSAGVGGPITGARADLIIVDDPVKSRQDAESAVYRERTWDWYRNDVYTRLRPGGRMVLIQTRWHPDDLAGRLLEEMAAGGDQWRVVCLPALADSPDDPMGRPIGAALWPEWEDEAALARKRAVVGERDFAALFQQQPRVAEGALIMIEMIGTLDAAPAGGSLVRAWDLAATEQVGTRDPDWTVGVLMQRLDGRFTVQDVVRLRGGPEAVEQAIVATAQRDGKGVRISLPQDPGQAGKAQVLYLTKHLIGYVVESTPETGDKATRAMPLVSQANVGNVSLVRAPWNRAYLEELRDFPGGTKDDQVDASSRAFNTLTAAPAPARRMQINIIGR